MATKLLTRDEALAQIGDERVEQHRRETEAALAERRAERDRKREIGTLGREAETALDVARVLREELPDQLRRLSDLLVRYQGAVATVKRTNGFIEKLGGEVKAKLPRGFGVPHLVPKGPAGQDVNRHEALVLKELLEILAGFGGG